MEFVSSNGTEDASTAGYTAYEGGAHNSNRKDIYRSKNYGGYSSPQKESKL